MCIQATRFSLGLLLAASAITIQAQMPATRSYLQQPAPVSGQVVFRPVPLEGSQARVEGSQARVAQGRQSPQPQQPDWNLQWRRSARVAPVRTVAAHTSEDVFAPQAAAVQPGLQPAGRTPTLHSVAQSTWLTQQQPAEVVETPRELTLDEPQERVPNFFTDPFGDDPLAGEPPAEPMDEDALFPPPAQGQADAAAPTESAPQNQLRSEFDRLNQPLREMTPPTPPPDEVESPPQQAPPQTERAEKGPSLGDMLRENQPDDELGPPRSRPFQFDANENPFPERQPPAERRAEDSRDWYQTDEVISAPAMSCDELRERIAKQTIDQVSLDISPPYRPDEIDMEKYEKLKADFDEKQIVRQWTSVDGQPLTTGRLRDLAYEEAVIETPEGTIQRLPLSRLSEADLGYISENWGLPSECQLPQIAYVPRDWTRSTMTWKASNLCHNPLYFQDVNLERYGHTHGPFLEPVVQSVQFFGNIVALPYSMGVHPPNECQYPLGYYRPGNCAPWITQPIPLSIRGGLTQAATMTGLFWLIP